jgi:Tol biopolymer transport system component
MIFKFPDGFPIFSGQGNMIVFHGEKHETRQVYYCNETHRNIEFLVVET